MKKNYQAPACQTISVKLQPLMDVSIIPNGLGANVEVKEYTGGDTGGFARQNVWGDDEEEE